jgi:hypothetical protein
MRSPTERFVLVAAVLVSALVAGWVGLESDAPKSIPGFALASAAVWHLEVASAFFVALYIGVLAVALAWQGKGFAKFTGPGGVGIEATELQLVEDSQAALNEAVEQLATALEELTALLDD